MECKASGTVPLESLQALEDLLVGLSGAEPEPVHTREISLRGPTPSTVVLVSNMYSPDKGWGASLYGLPLRGKQALNLEGTVRSVVHSACCGRDVPLFWTALGMKQAYELERQGCSFVVPAAKAGMSIKIVLSQLYKPSAEGPRQELVPSHGLVEASALCVDGAHVETCAAIGSMAQGSVSPLLSTLPNCVEVDSGTLFLCCLTPDAVLPDPATLSSAALCHVLDPELVYEPFCADFGPCNLAHTWRICQTLARLRAAAARQGLPVLLLVGAHPHRHANAAVALGAYRVLIQGMSARAACEPLRALRAVPGFRDASSGTPLFGLGVEAVVAGLARARDVGFLSWHAGAEFDVEEYEHYEQVENGDLNWIVPGKLMAFSSPSASPRHYGGWRTFMPEDYVPYFRGRGVEAVVRLNKRMYDSARFTAHGVDHHELYFPDGTCPSPAIQTRFLELAEGSRGALAVHCKAGLGRTGVLICAYMIKHHGFSAEEAMGYIRVARPGSVIGPQQLYLRAVAPGLRAEGAALSALRESRALPPLGTCARQAEGEEQENGTWARRGGETTAAPAPGDDDGLDFLVSVPAALGKASVPAAVHVRVDAGATAAMAPAEQAAVQPLATRTSSLASVGTPPRTSAPHPLPPSSTKRVLAPNGQPRKIPLAMDFDKATAADLEDVAVEDGEDSWRLSARPAASQHTGGNRMSSVLANGAAAVVGALRSAAGGVMRQPSSSG